MDVFTTLMLLAPSDALPDDGLTITAVAIELIIAAFALILTFLFSKRFLKILCLCTTEVCLFLACRQYFGSDSLITEIMRWLTALVVCVITVSIVNRINWSNLRDKNGK